MTEEEQMKEEREMLLNSKITNLYKGEAYKFLNMFGHNFLFLEINGNNNPDDYGVLLEFGGFYNSNSSFGEKVHYWKEDGMRFLKLTHTKIRPYIGRKYTLHERNLSLKELIESCWEQHSWNRDDYGFFDHNSQDFVVVALKIINYS